jgi:hypothetical protein
VQEELEKAARIEAELAETLQRENTTNVDDESDEDEDDGKDDEPGHMFSVSQAKGDEVRLRLADPGRKRVSARPDLTSGYALAQIAKAVQSDLNWKESSEEEDNKGEGEAANAGINPIVPQWRTIWIYLVTCADDGDTDTEAGVLHTVVLPLLRAKYSQRMLHIMFCDPRRGIGEQAHSSDTVGQVLDELEGCISDSVSACCVRIRLCLNFEVFVCACVFVCVSAYVPICMFHKMRQVFAACSCVHG